jgi:exonuclease III
MRIITWNLMKAKSTSKVWSILNDLNPDLILKQELKIFSTRYVVEILKVKGINFHFF